MTDFCVLMQACFSNGARVVSYRVVPGPAEVVGTVEDAGSFGSCCEVARPVADYGEVYGEGGLGKVSTC